MRGLLLLFDGIHLEGGAGAGAFYAAFGFLFVFLGIVLLILILSLVGFIMKRVTARKEKAAPPAPPEKLPAADSDISPEEIAAITAALAVCLEGERRRCDFVVRRIKRL